MSAADFALLSPYLTAIRLAKGEALVDLGAAVQQSWFIEAGIASVVLSTAQGNQTEVGIVGYEGMVDIATLHGVGHASHRCFIQLPGAALRLPAAVLQAALETSPSLRALLLAYAYSFMAQVAGTALANASFTLDQRLARWLLMCHDRVSDDDVAMTHEFLSLMLNVRRAGVTVAIQNLERLGLVSGRRGTITIIDRAALGDYAADSYGSPERVYALEVAA